jgi:CelD/BcsL family acetyltransferase involved in cellulose biosynthesis
MSKAEVSNSYSIRIIDDIHDPDLVRHWKRIAEETDCFPQMYYEWCEPWWRLQSGNRKLHVVAVEDAGGKIVGIAPMCIEKRFSLRVLRSFPVHFGDYFSFLADEEGQAGEIVAALVDHLKTYKAWHVVHLFNVNTESLFWDVLQARGFVGRKITDIRVADFRGQSFEEFLGTLSRNSRSQFRKKLRRLEKNGDVTLEYIEDASGYLAHVDDMRRLYELRWLDDHRLAPDDVHYECRNAAVTACCQKGKMALFLLKLDGRMLVFRLGFMHKGAFYDWRVCHDQSAESYSPGTLIVGKIIEELISRGYSQFNFMTGDYRYKRSWAPQESASVNCQLFAAGRSLRARLYVKYRLDWRDSLRSAYYRLLGIRWVRTAWRWLQTRQRRNQTRAH